MSTNACLQLSLYLVVLLACVKPLGAYMARVYQGRPFVLDRVLGWLERSLYRLAGVNDQAEMTWRQYATAVLVFNGIGFLALYALLRLQGFLPLNPQKFGAVRPDLAFNTSVSFVTNTNWQSYGGESSLSYLSQMLGLGVQNFVSAATGMSVLVALIRGLARRSSETIGNFWVDLTRSVLYILLPLSLVLALVLVSQGVVQNFRPYERASLIDSSGAEANTVAEQTLPMGPAASQIAIKQLGTNGGGFFNANSSHPYENPTPLSNFLQMLAILLIPAALCHTFGVMAGDTRQGRAILAAMLAVFVPLALGTVVAEQAGTSILAKNGISQRASSSSPGGNMEGKETRFGITDSALWACATTAASNGCVNSMHDSFTPLGGLIPLWLMQLGEVVFGGMGSGLYGMLMFVVVAVFVAGLMVGRTPEYLGKKIEVYEMKMASLIILIPPLLVLIGTAVAVSGPGLAARDRDTGTVAALSNTPGAHGFTEILYTYSSTGNNNGSAFSGLSTDVPFYNLTLAVAMLAARFWLIIPILAVAGSLARKKSAPQSAGTLPTHTPLFVGLLVCVVLLVGALTFVPALALGPIVEQLQMTSH